ncbi:glycosyltransferase [Paenibacillus roseipurpureus]|uniref:Glycosyltransferase n=1 Tax=Paenibacillus roseopurpureus TaxID=2918901 RepID=A0AA96LSI1_9BACL|nr:glycosyltransferase [Paenibacillus sp. MBLB1832]WNR45746.1 glycosyltransferase [Paenibacillus sp. MBLB1832]
MKSKSKKPSKKQAPIKRKSKRGELMTSAATTLLKRDSTLTRSQHFWRSKGLQAGTSYATTLRASQRVFQNKVLSDAWVKWYKTQPRLAELPNYVEASKGFISGVSKVLKKEPPNWVLLPTKRTVGAIVTVSNAEGTIVQVLEQLQRLALEELIVIVHGSTDRTLERVRANAKGQVVLYRDFIGQDVGRAIGTKRSKSDILLFLEGNQIVAAEKLIPFIQDIEKGSDIALNNVTPYTPPFSQWDTNTVMKHFLNVSLNRTDLYVNSLADVPHAISRKALQIVDQSELMVSPKAHTHAVLAGLRITAPTSVKPAAASTSSKGVKNEASREGIRSGIGDHVEALQMAMQAKGGRIDFLDIIRNREVIEGE